ncbi:MAG: right-handed parallel beta-helix repeat-containing protein [Anaerolineales bacterium]|nr:right-handed parallel beta-helix repeat-containing protein [Anaerolineales bacterium]
MPTLTSTPPPTAAPTLTFTPLPTITSTLTPTAAPTRTATPIRPTEVVSCPGAPAIMLEEDRLAQVSMETAVSNRVRMEPGLDGEIVGLIGAGETILVDDGPICADGYAWWHVQSFTGLQGWTAEGDQAGYWLIPILPKMLAQDHTVTLTASQVSGASDIEFAIRNVTAQGARAGTVILDGREGPFVYSTEDLSINIFVSNLTLLGVNSAKIENCADGLFFDNFPLENIRVEGIEFVCQRHGVEANGTFSDVKLRGNVFRTVMPALALGGTLDDWLVEQNLIESLSNAIEAGGVADILIQSNYIAGWEGILLRQGSQFKIIGNLIHSQRWGIHLVQGSAMNRVEKNYIYYQQYSGIILFDGARDNQILSNVVTCPTGEGCLSVDAGPEERAVNTIRGNLP